MDIEVVIYIAISILWVIIQGVRKRKKAQMEKEANSEPQYQDQEENPRSDRSLLDEVLEEIRKERELEPEYFDPRKSSSSETYQKPKIETIPYEAAPIKKVHPISKIKAKEKDNHFNEYKLSETRLYEEDGEEASTIDYAGMIFGDPDSPRKAIILSEIFNRKHF